MSAEQEPILGTPNSDQSKATRRGIPLGVVGFATWALTNPNRSPAFVPPDCFRCQLYSENCAAGYTIETQSLANEFLDLPDEDRRPETAFRISQRLHMEEVFKDSGLIERCVSHIQANIVSFEDELPSGLAPLPLPQNPGFRPVNPT
jgi:hypothetical protein